MTDQVWKYSLQEQTLTLIQGWAHGQQSDVHSLNLAICSIMKWLNRTSASITSGLLKLSSASGVKKQTRCGGPPDLNFVKKLKLFSLFKEESAHPADAPSLRNGYVLVHCGNTCFIAVCWRFIEENHSIARFSLAIASLGGNSPAMRRGMRSGETSGEADDTFARPNRSA